MCLYKQTETLTITQNKTVCLTIAYTVTVNRTSVDFLSEVSGYLVAFNEEDLHNRILVCFTSSETPVMSSQGALGEDWQAGLQGRTHPQSGITIHQINYPLYCKKSASKSVFAPFLKLNIFKTRHIYMKQKLFSENIKVQKFGFLKIL